MNGGDLYEELTSPKKHGKWAYVGWGAVIFIVGVSIASLLTQGILAVKDQVFAGSNGSGKVAENSSSNNGSSANSNSANANNSGNSGKVDESRPLGSDDSASSASGNSDDPKNQYSLSGEDTLPRTSAVSYLAADLETGEIIIEHNEGFVGPIASVSKLMTATIAKEQMNLQDIAIVSRDAYNTYGAQGSLGLGEKIRLYDLMYPLLMESSNDGAEVFADSYKNGHAAFLAEMNKKAQELGMTNTYYEDPSGLNPKNVSSVGDLLKLARYIHKQHPDIFDITRVRQYTILKHQWTNQNRLLNYDNFIGGKNGYIDESKKTTVSLFNIQLARGGSRSVAIILLRTDDREGDALKVINYLKKDAYFNPEL